MDPPTPARGQPVPSGARYSSSLTFSIQVTGEKSTDSWIATWVIAASGVAPCQCLCSAGHQRMSPEWNSSFGPPSIWVQPTPSVTMSVWPAGWVCQAVRAPGSKRTIAPLTREGSGRWNWPALADFLLRYPDVQVDLVVDNALQDIVSERFDAGIRMGERVARDMIAVRIGPEISMAAVATPAYFAQRGRPKTPQDLAQHSCINMRFATLGNVYAWEFEKGSREVNVRVEGQLTVNDIAVIRQAALNGLGIAFVPEDVVRQDLESGALVRVLTGWTPPFPGYYLYYPSRRQQSPAFALLVEALRYRGT